MSVIQARPVGPLDIAGDIHGEYEALVNLLGHLGQVKVITRRSAPLVFVATSVTVPLTTCAGKG